MKIENWNGYDIRFVEVKGEWYAILKDICDALGLKTFDVSQRLDPESMIKVTVWGCDMGSNEVRSKKARKSQIMLAVDESGIYEALFASRKLEARKFRHWTTTVLRKLRRYVGLEGYEVMRMTEKDIQDEIDNILDTLFWDDEKKMLMQSVTVQGGDVEQVPFEY